MNKETLIQYARELHQEAFDANQYYLLMQQYWQYQKDYVAEMKLSPTFYNVVYGALLKACFMEIAKLYDQSNGAISIGSFLKQCRENTSVFPEYQNDFTVEDNGKVYSFPIPYQHQLKPEEERFFKDQVESQRAIFKAFDIPDSESKAVTVGLTFSDFLELYQKRFCSLSKKQDCIRERRNKIYAHNDEQRFNDMDSILRKNPITYPDIQELIDFALDCTGLILGALTGECPARQYANLDDWDNTLWFAQLGIKYDEHGSKQK